MQYQKLKNVGRCRLLTEQLNIAACYKIDEIEKIIF